MSAHANPDIVQDGLVLCLDVADKKCYSGSGNSITDRAKRHSGALYNGVSFVNDSSGGYLNFSASDDYLEFDSVVDDLRFQPTEPYSVFGWFYNISAGGALVANMKASPPHEGWDIWGQDSARIAMHFIKSWSGNAIKIQINFDYSSHSNKWVYFGYTYDGSCPTNTTDSKNSINFYTNAELTETNKTVAAGGFDSSSEVISYPSGQKFRVGQRYGASANATKLGRFEVYNKALTAAETLQNFNATKSRFGL